MNKLFNNQVIEGVSNILGDTVTGLTGSEIKRFLSESNIEDLKPKETKRIRLYLALKNDQEKFNSINHILHFLQNVLSPVRYVGAIDAYNVLMDRINEVLAFAGFKISDSGKIFCIDRAEKLSDIQIKINSLKNKLQSRDAHPSVFYYCKAELLADNYFHAVFEANKGLFQRIRELSGVKKDGINLIEEVFSKNPILIINNFQKQSEIDEHFGFCSLLKGLCSMFRNPQAHEAKINWLMTEQDSLDILSIISYCHRRLDNAQKIRNPDMKCSKNLI